jgi:hypothetical protein
VILDRLAAAVWTPMQRRIAAKTGLWRVNAWAWNREARQLDELADAMTAVSGLAGSTEQLRTRAARLRQRAQEERPS